MEPTSIGTNPGNSDGEEKERERRWYMYGRCISRLCSASSAGKGSGANSPVERRVDRVSVSRGREPRGVE